ncbi:EAL domain-containing protein [Afipia felis]|uniref:Cyclic di-GMP phosphodiesterase Gmr n=2 Tax=Afipia felis TaxID=1035 RepID=A0A380WC18_AFIFE|nr:EAL domain-containing protein [Afipia felis]EKS29584.1 diguanylate cyclase (GGDEF) domain-containing protein [Afipia felis ATCC 53690]SUU78291.1 Cyclic di-GMP phosphodiesterase Gmr [Afipia felis]SUU86356.1 Cyclic di-GMP phosphodiesterase Gmr [Afipia felis]
MWVSSGHRAGRETLLAVPRRLLAAVTVKGTIRTQILICCLLMSAIIAALGVYATSGIRHAADLVAKTFDESLMSINYARATAADFSNMRAASARRLVSKDPESRAALDKEIDNLVKTLHEDLNIAAERSQSALAVTAARKVQEAADAWTALHHRVVGEEDKAGGTPAMQAQNGHAADLDHYARTVDQQIELLVNYTAGDGFLFRQHALSAINRDINFNLVALAVALLLSGFLSWRLSRRIIGQVAVASKAARCIAEGKLDVGIPAGGVDELGTLISAMGVMRNNIKDMMEREIAQRRSAQARLTDALETSQAGVVLLQADGQIALANSRATEFLAEAPDLLRCSPFEDQWIENPLVDFAPAALQDSASEARLPNGRWLRVSRSVTQERGMIVVFSDITALKKQEEQLHETNRRLDAALENMSQGLCLYDKEARLQVVNRRFCEIFNIPVGSVQAGMSFESVLMLSVMAGNHEGQNISDLLAERKRFLSREKIDNYYQQLSDDRVICVRHRPTSDGGWLTTCEDVTEQHQAESKITFMARHDALTQLPNRVLLAERIEHAIAQVGRGTGFSILCLDLDNFKQVNDTLGHPVGDELLCAVADRLCACVREVDTVARLGGDEFAIIQADTQRPEDAERLARRIVECIAEPYEFDGQRVVIGCSIGISLSPGDGTSGEKLLKNADVALYRAKSEGRGIWRFFETEMDESLQKRRALELDLREALDRQQFELFYQPLYDIELDKICGFEALLRWRHPTRGLVPPEQFISIAEEIGLIIPLGEWVVQEACRQASIWPDDLKVAVNVSSVQFRSPRLLDSFSRALSASQLPPQRLELEITESVFLTNNAETIEILHKLRALGLRIALDDFGTGYSSLSYLRSFPFNKLKIDQSFVRDLTDAEGSKVIIRAIVSLGKSLGMRTTAEGVQTIAQLNYVAAEGCNEVQGYFFSKPVAASEIPSILRACRNGFKKDANGIYELAS